MNEKVLLQDLAEGLAKKSGLSAAEAEAFVRMAFAVVADALKEEKVVKVKGLGTFKLITVESRESVDVNTGERITIKGYAKVTFTPEASLRDAVNRPFAQFETVILNQETDAEEMAQVDGVVPDESAAEDSDEESASDSEEEEEEQPDPDEDIHGDAQASDEEPSVTVVAAEAETVVASDTAAAEESVSAVSPAVANVSEELHEEHDEKEDPENVPVAGESIVVEHQHADYQRVTEQKVTELHVTSQRIEHQTITNQKIVHPDTDKGRLFKGHFSVWGVIALIVLVLSLMVVSYMAGYYRWLCPGSLLQEVQEKTAQMRPAAHVSDTLQQVVKHDLAASDKIVPSEQEETAPEQSASVPPSADNKKEVQPSPATYNAARKQQLREKAARYPQRKGGKYLIVGVKRNYRLQKGESLLKVAHKIYGSKGFVDYIILMNHIENPDLVAVGTVLKLPELVLNEN